MGRAAVVLALLGSAIGVGRPAAACDLPPCDPPVTIAVVEATGGICETSCAALPDPLRPHPGTATGLSSATSGPAIQGSFTMTTTSCVSTWSHCALSLLGTIGPGPEGAGAYCERWRATGTGVLSLRGFYRYSLAFTFTWDSATGLVGAGDVAVTMVPRSRTLNGERCGEPPMRTFAVEALVEAH